jgi:hypothetical protein
MGAHKERPRVRLERLNIESFAYFNVQTVVHVIVRLHTYGWKVD